MTGKLMHVTAIMVLSAVAAPAQSAIIFTDGGTASGSPVTFVDQTGSTVLGSTQGATSNVSFGNAFTGLGNLLTADAATDQIIAGDVGASSLYRLFISLTDGGLFNDFQVNLFGREGFDFTGVTFTVTDNLGIEHQFQSDVSLADHFFSISADGGQAIASILIDVGGSNGWRVTRDIELSPVGGMSSPVPEPSTWAMILLGFAGIGLAMRRRGKAKPSELARD